MILTIAYILFFLYLNYTIYASLKIGFAKNKKQLAVVGSCLLFLVLFHCIFTVEGMLPNKAFFLLFIFSLSIIIMKYMAQLNRFIMDLRIKKSNPDLYESDAYGTFSSISTFMSQVLMPAGITVFQIIVIFNPEIQNGMNH
ncbi:hypothetical protein [Flavobacterium humi]|uniref:Uncharacterized protein n=1 Tax=Flavobacterium humi TaxID=2562683 RepID=A0A4Z0L487_9FLAO|nr:hypothetical protein [Flavobacterium humi]TGD57267.1 hypothetical protein E4635_11630 [Flavobacterium humi]